MNAPAPLFGTLAAVPLVEIDSQNALNQLISQRIGLRIDDASRSRVTEAVASRMRQSKDATTSDYLQRLMKADSAPEWRELSQELSIGESYFFRGMDHFDALRDVVLPARQRARGGERRFSVLCAGCAGGEEPYSVAMLLSDQPQLAGYKVEIVGTDVSPSLLAKAEQGIYTAWSLRDMSPALVSRYFSPGPSRTFALQPSVKAMVRFEERNLLDPAQQWPAGYFDAIFCRNVLIYFTPESIREMVGRFESALAPGGFLFLGHSENLRGVSKAFDLRYSQGGFFYQLAGAGPAPSAAPPPPSPPALSALVEPPRAAPARPASALAAAASKPAAAPTPKIGYEAALRAFREERYAEAADLLGGDHASVPTLQLLRAAALTHAGRVAEAESVCRRLLTTSAFNAETFYLMAVCRESAGDIDGAIDQAQQALHLDAGFAMSHLLIGRLTRRRGRKEFARRALSTALGLIAVQHEKRTQLFGGGFGREALMQLCRTELDACGVQR